MRDYQDWSCTVTYSPGDIVHCAGDNFILNEIKDDIKILSSINEFPPLSKGTWKILTHPTERKAEWKEEPDLRLDLIKERM